MGTNHFIKRHRAGHDSLAEREITARPLLSAGAPRAASALEIYWRILKERRLVVLVVALVVFGGVALGTVFQTSIYRATGVLEIRKESTEVLPIESLFSLENISDVALETQLGVLRSDTLSRRVAEQLQLQSLEEFNPQPAWWRLSAAAKGQAPVQWEPIVKRFQQRLIIDPVKGSRLVKVSFDSPDPELAARAANAVMLQYVETRVEETRNTESWLYKQLQATRAKLEDGERQLQEFARENRLQFLERESGDLESLASEKLRQIQQELTQAQAVRYDREAIYDSVRRGGPYRWLPNAPDNKVMQDLTVRLADLRREQAHLASTFTAEYPKLQQVTQQIAEIENQLQAERKRAADRVANDYFSARRREDLLRSALDQQQMHVGELSQKVAGYNILGRGVETTRELYTELQKKLKEATVSTALKAANAGVVDAATTPLQPIRPDVALNLLLGATVGLLLGVGAALVVQRLDVTLHTVDEMAVLELPTLGMVPSASSLNAAIRKPLPLLTAKGVNGKWLGEKFLAGKNWVLASGRSRPAQIAGWLRIDRDGARYPALREAFGSLRTSVLLNHEGPPPRLLLITSASPGEGKTTISVNLAISLARLGRRVLIIDADVRRPSVHKAVALTNGAGLVGYLTGTADWRVFMQPNVIPGLDVLTAGKSPEDPAALLSSEKMAALANEARESYDFVIMDSPAIFINAPDARILGSIADSTVVVVRSGATSHEVLQRALTMVPPVDGLILNDMNVDLLPGYYRNYYAYTANPEIVEKRVVSRAQPLQSPDASGS